MAVIIGKFLELTFETRIPVPTRRLWPLRLSIDADGAVEADAALPREPQVKRGRSGGLNRPGCPLPRSVSLS
jgi:hypothetical protein